MRRKTLLLTVLIQLAIASSTIATVLPVHAATYAPGVSAGNYMKYTATETYSSTDPSMQNKPQFLKDIDNTAFARLDVQTVSGTSVTSKETEHFNNGTADKTMVLIGDVAAGTGNATSNGPLIFIIAGGLVANDKLCTGSNFVCTLAVNSTQSRTYAGASRTDDFVGRTFSFGGNSTSFSTYWDQASGILTEISLSITQTSGSSHQYSTTASVKVVSSETNVWSGTIFGLSPLVFYGIIGAIVVIVAIIAVAMIMRMRKPKAQAMPAPTGTTNPAPGP